MTELERLQAHENHALQEYNDADKSYHSSVIRRQDALENLKRWQRKITELNVSQQKDLSDDK